MTPCEVYTLSCHPRLCNRLVWQSLLSTRCETGNVLTSEVTPFSVDPSHHFVLIRLKASDHWQSLECESCLLEVLFQQLSYLPSHYFKSKSQKIENVSSYRSTGLVYFSLAHFCLAVELWQWWDFGATIGHILGRSDDSSVDVTLNKHDISLLGKE